MGDVLSSQILSGPLPLLGYLPDPCGYLHLCPWSRNCSKMVFNAGSQALNGEGGKIIYIASASVIIPLLVP